MNKLAVAAVAVFLQILFAARTEGRTEDRTNT